jgi:hypothetical protein
MAELEDMIADIIMLGSQNVLDDDDGGKTLKCVYIYI